MKCETYEMKLKQTQEMKERTSCIENYKRCWPLRVNNVVVTLLPWNFHVPTLQISKNASQMLCSVEFSV